MELPTIILIFCIVVATISILIQQQRADEELRVFLMSRNFSALESAIQNLVHSYRELAAAIGHDLLPVVRNVVAAL